MRTLLIVSLILYNVTTIAQRNKISVGFEQDVLPYLTNGYYFGAWAGKSHVRARFLMAHVHKPDFIVPNGFTNNIVTAYALVGDYFLRSDFSGWWVSGGLVYWNSSIQSDQMINTTEYKNGLLNGSIGYSWKFYKNFYLSPWAGMHIRVTGAKEVSVDGTSFKTPLLNPEASIKIGWYWP